MSRKKTLKFLISCALSIFFLYLAFRNVAFKQLITVFKQINYWWTIPFVIITVLGMYIRAIRWRWILKSRYNYPSYHLFPSLMIGFALNSLLPLRAGEFARPFVLSRREKIPYSTVFATVVVERIVDGLTLLICFLIVFLFVKIDPKAELPFGKYVITGEMLTSLTKKLSMITFILLVGVITIIVDKTRRIYELCIERIPLLSQGIKEKLIHILEHFSHGFHSLKNFKYVLMIMLYSLVIWALVGFSLQVMSWGFNDLSLNFFHGMAVTIIICIAIMIPAAPGYWGLYECGGIFALMALGLISQEKGQATALSFSLVIHTLQIVPIVIIGIFYMWKENISLKQIEDLSADQEPSLETRDLP